MPAAPSGRNCATTSSRWRARNTCACGTNAASSALPGGSTSRVVVPPEPSRCSARLMASAPRTGRNSPPSESSPANSQPASFEPSIWPAAARMPSAIGRSKRPESLGRSAGARLTVMRLLLGNSSPALAIAERTRSRASFTSVSTSPTNVKLGSPLARCTSTCTGRASSPISARLCTNDKPIRSSIPVSVHWPLDAGMHIFGAALRPRRGDHVMSPGWAAAPVGRTFSLWVAPAGPGWSGGWHGPCLGL